MLESRHLRNSRVLHRLDIVHRRSSSVVRSSLPSRLPSSCNTQLANNYRLPDRLQPKQSPRRHDMRPRRERRDVTPASSLRRNSDLQLDLKIQPPTFLFSISNRFLRSSDHYPQGKGGVSLFSLV